jgi:hypothetical protein
MYSLYDYIMQDHGLTFFDAYMCMQCHILFD